MFLKLAPVWFIHTAPSSDDRNFPPDHKVFSQILLTVLYKPVASESSEDLVMM